MRLLALALGALLMAMHMPSLGAIAGTSPMALMHRWALLRMLRMTRMLGLTAIVHTFLTTLERCWALIVVATHMRPMMLVGATTMAGTMVQLASALVL